MQAASSIPKVPSQVPVMDSLRGLAALLVFFAHVGQQFLPLHQSALGKRAVEYLGVWAVSVFFVLSGYLIHSGSLREVARTGTVDWRQYARRRLCRIYPAYFTALILSVGAGLVAQSNMIYPPTFAGFIEHMLLISTFSPQQWEGINAVLWTVVVECHFYLAYPVVFLLFRRYGAIKSTSGIILFSLSGFVILTLLSQGETRVMLQHTSPVLWWKWCLGALLAEVAAGHVWFRLSSILSQFWLLPLLVSISFIGILIPEPGMALQFQRFALPFFIFFIVGACVFSAGHASQPRLLRWFGDISYSIYLLHPLALLAVVHLSISQFPAQLFLATGITLVAASISYYTLEKPFIRLGHLGFKRNRGLI